MYIPSYFRNENHDDLLAFMRAHPLAVICSNGPEAPQATHLPFIVREEEKKIILVSHFAKANPHAAMLQKTGQVIVIFSGRDAYISPSHYEKKENVPTWNYIAVHATGTIRFLNSEEEKSGILQETIMNFDPGYKKQWDNLPSEYISGMMKGISAFEIEVTTLEGKFKLSQNKTTSEQAKIADDPEMPAELSAYMKKNNESPK
ncbi:MAG: FMN-binding negative transcriptional regulator [Bacteroidota bacterium]|nr:FMN-binding negative transcriptional regulator [Bacteroidota bacterium]